VAYQGRAADPDAMLGGFKMMAEGVSKYMKR